MRKIVPFPPELKVLVSRMAGLRTLFAAENDRMTPDKLKLRQILRRLRNLELDVDGFRTALAR